jgi:tetratricopeptide (TPR) repeat protein
VPGDVAVLETRAQVAEARGDLAGAIAALRQAIARRPTFQALANVAMMEYRHGEIDAAREHLGRLLERSPSSYRGLSLLATIELLEGDLGRAIELYRRLAEINDGATELSNLGLALLLSGRSDEAVATYRRVWEGDPGNPMFTLNLADATEALGRHAEAADLYRRVLELVEGDPSAGHWQMLTVRAQALAHLGRSLEAVRTVQQALQAAPGNAQVAYEASLVYALVGDHVAARASAEEARERGISERWFELPWFASITALPGSTAAPAEPGER